MKESILLLLRQGGINIENNSFENIVTRFHVPNKKKTKGVELQILIPELFINSLEEFMSDNQIGIENWVKTLKSIRYNNRKKLIENDLERFRRTFKDI